MYNKREEHIKYRVQFGFYKKKKEGRKINFAYYISVPYKPQFA